MEFWPALETSRRLIIKYFWWVLLFSFVQGFIIVAGLLLLCVGILATIPLAYIMSYAAFADITRLNEDPANEAGEGIEKHLIE
jgi:hypothetical protein